MSPLSPDRRDEGPAEEGQTRRGARRPVGGPQREASGKSVTLSCSPGASWQGDRVGLPATPWRRSWRHEPGVARQ